MLFSLFDYLKFTTGVGAYASIATAGGPAARAKALQSIGPIEGAEGPCSLRKNMGKGGEFGGKGVEGLGGREFVGGLRAQKTHWMTARTDNRKGRS